MLWCGFCSLSLDTRKGLLNGRVNHGLEPSLPPETFRCCCFVLSPVVSFWQTLETGSNEGFESVCLSMAWVCKLTYLETARALDECMPEVSIPTRWSLSISPAPTPLNRDEKNEERQCLSFAAFCRFHPFSEVLSQLASSAWPPTLSFLSGRLVALSCVWCSVTVVVLSCLYVAI